MMKMKTTIATLLTGGAMALALGQAAMAGTASTDAKAAAAPTTAAADMTEGEVRKIDKEAGKLTLKHSEIKNLQMPGMTMVFQVKHKVLLDKLEVGDKVRFRAEQSGSGYAVTAIEPAK